MNCLTESEIQMYIDDELLATDKSKAEQHIGSCPNCASVHNTLKSNKAEIFKLLDELKTTEEPINIPVFIPATPKYTLAKIITTLSVAASIILIIGFGFYLNNKHNQQQQALNIVKATNELTQNSDPNQMLHDKQMIIVITNSSGEVVHTYISE